MRLIAVTVRAELMKKASQLEDGVVFADIEEFFNLPEQQYASE